MFKCYKCGHINESNHIFRSTICPSCKAELKVCLMCANYDKNSSNQCLENNAELIVEKDKANFCDWFVINPDIDRTISGTEENDRKSQAKKAFDNLFGES